jgi:hypothetical protein
MKIFLPTNVLLHVFFQILFSQSDTTYLSYYPLHTNNYWQYYEYIEDYIPPMYQIKYYSIEVLGDTLLPNGKEYKILEKTYLDTSQYSFYLYERIDTLSGNVYRYSTFHPNDEYLLDSLKSQPGDTSLSARSDLYTYNSQGYVCLSIYPDTVLNLLTTSIEFEGLFILLPTKHKLSSGLGFSYLTESYDFGMHTIVLRYAVIEGTEYGVPVTITSDYDTVNSRSLILNSNYPNPFNSVTVIEFSLSKPVKVEIDIFSIDGRKTENIESANLDSGVHRYLWDGSDYPSGVYIYRINSLHETHFGKCILIK